MENKEDERCSNYENNNCMEEEEKDIEEEKEFGSKYKENSPIEEDKETNISYSPQIMKKKKRRKKKKWQEKDTKSINKDMEEKLDEDEEKAKQDISFRNNDPEEFEERIIAEKDDNSQVIALSLNANSDSECDV